MASAPKLISVVDCSESASRSDQPQLMLPIVYGLNRSFSKKIYAGILVEGGHAHTKIRLTSNDFIGLTFNPVMWKNFVDSFEHITKFFKTGRDNHEMLDQKIVGCGFTVRFVISHRDKAIEIEEEDKSDSQSVFKKFRRSIIMKHGTFEGIKRYLPCIDARIAHLAEMETCIDFVIRRVVTCVKKLVAERENDHVKSTDGLLDADPKFSDDQFKEIADEFYERRGFQATMADIQMIYYEIVNLNYSCNEPNYGV